MPKSRNDLRRGGSKVPQEAIFPLHKEKEDACETTDEMGVRLESRSNEFSELFGIGPDNEANLEILIQGADIGAHEAAIFLEAGAGDTNCPSLIFTSQPYTKSDDNSKWVDIKRLIVSGDRKGQVDVMHSSCNLANGGCLGLDGRLYFCFQGRGITKRDEHSAKEEENGDFLYHHPSGIYSVNPKTFQDWTAVTPQSTRFNSPNDIVTKASDGTFWFTDPSYAYAQGIAPEPVLGDWVWRYCPQTEELSVVADGFAKPNGIVFAPNGNTVYITDTGSETGTVTNYKLPRTIYAFDIIQDRLLANRRLIYVADCGIPDGIKCDDEGRIYTGCADGVHVVQNDGRLLGKILLTGCHSGAANLCFGTGEHQGSLYILAERAVVAVKLDTTVRPPRNS